MDIEKTPGAINPALKLVRKLQENKSSLHIGRIPDKTRKLFIEIAEDEFCSDYGMLLKFLLDKVISGDNKHIIEKLEEQDERIQKLEFREEEKKELIKTLNGKVLTVNKKLERGIKKNE